jgi:protein-tyrosine phosphatase
MIPLVDLHCHLLAGLDDGPRTAEEALAMCRLAYGDGTHMASALAHQNEHWPANTPDRLRAAAGELAARLRAAGVPLTVFPGAEVMVRPGLEQAWHAGDLLGVAGGRRYLLIEMPDGVVLELDGLVGRLVRAGVRPILAHPERYPELLHDRERVEALVRAGCLVQVSAGSVTRPANRRDERALRDWFRSGLVHLLGSDGHSRHRRPPTLGDAYRRIAHLAGDRVADRVCSSNGMAVLQGLPLGPAVVPAACPTWLGRLLSRAVGTA